LPPLEPVGMQESNIEISHEEQSPNNGGSSVGNIIVRHFERQHD